MQRSTLLGFLSTLVVATIALFLLSSLPACDEKTEGGPSRPAAATYEPPPLQGAVTDTAGKLSAADDAALEARIADYRRRTGNEIAVFIIGSLAGRSIEDVAYGAFNGWGIGKAGADNGVLLVIAPNERRIRIETGKGIGDRLTDLESARILRERTGPLLKQDRIRDAIDATLDAIEAALDGRPPPPLPQVLAPAAASGADAGAALSAMALYVVDHAGALDPAAVRRLEEEARAHAYRWARRFAVVIVPSTAKIDASIRQELVRRRRAGAIAPSIDCLALDAEGFVVFVDASNRDVVLTTTSRAPRLAPDLHGRLAQAARNASSLEDAVRAVGEIAATEADRLDKLTAAEVHAYRERHARDQRNAMIITGGVALLVLAIGVAIARRARAGGWSSSDASSYVGYTSSDSSSYPSSSWSSSTDTSYHGGGGTSGGGGASDSY